MKNLVIEGCDNINPEAVLKVPIHVLEQINGLAEKYNISQIALIVAAINEYDKNWNEVVFKTNF